MRVCAFVFLLVSIAARAQFTYTIDQSIPVRLTNDELLTMPWAGGLNATQFNTLDLNQDGKNDLVIYDRTANRVITYLQGNNEYIYSPQYESFFPNEITNWLLLRDYNGDGLKDIFTGDNLGIKVYINTTQPGEPISFEQFLFYGGFAGPKSPVLLTKGFTGKINLQLRADDLPVISDMDGDGDLDILNPKFTGGSGLEYHQNFSMERYGTRDSLDFERITQAWAGVLDCTCGVFAFNGDPCNAGGRTEHAGGKSLFAFDADNDGDQDVLFSESECTELYLLRNDGTDAAPVITSVTSYPPTFPAQLVAYPAAFYEDVDFDNQKDLIVTPNIFAREFLQTNFKRSAWMYKNTGSTAAPVFAAPNQDFLQEKMIEVGDNAVPAFFDADADGDLDMFVGCYATGFSGSIYYFENIGSALAPEFKLVTEDFMGLTFLNLVNIKPSFADMNSDGKIDLVFTANAQFSGLSQLLYLPNTSSIGASFSTNVINLNFPITSTENIHIADVNKDGKNDLLLGKLNGAIQFWENTSASSTPSYTLADDSFLGFASSTLRQNPACTTGDLDGDGASDLIVGDQAGRLFIISDYRNANDGSERISEIVYNPVLETYISQNLGGRVWPTVANIFKTNKPALIVGNTLGGLHILKHDESVELPDSPVIDVYPNPVFKEDVPALTIKVDRTAVLYTFTVLGQVLGEPIFLQGFQEHTFSMTTFPKGIYVLYFFIEGKPFIRRIVVN